MLERPRIYRGWYVLAGLFCVYAASNGMLMNTLPLIYPALIDEFGWDEAQVTFPATVLFVVAALTSPPVGVMLDRFSPRALIAGGCVTMVVGLAAFSQVEQLWHMVAVYVLFALALSTCGIVSTMLVLTRWFNRLRGRATGILLLASSLGASVFPLILGASMQAAGWRSALMLLAAVAAGLAVVPTLWLIRDQPATGETDALASAESKRASPAVSASPGPTFREAARQPKFYLIALATGSIWFTIISLLQHQSIHLGRDLQFDRSLLPSVFSVFFATSVFGKFSFGWLSDRLDKGLTLMSSIGILLVSLFLIRSLDGSQTWLVYLYAAIAGVGFSGAFTTIQLWIASFYAGPSYGKILAGLTLFDTLSGALGTRIAGQMRTSLDSYGPVFTLMIGICTVAIICIALVKRIHSKERSTRQSSNSCGQHAGGPI